MAIVNGVRENGPGPFSLETGAFTAGTSPLTGTRVNKLSRKTFRHRDHRAQPYIRATPENRVCGEAGPSRITHTTRLQNSTPPHNDQDTVRFQTFLECLSSIDLPEQQKPGALCNSGESEQIFISEPATPPTRRMDSAPLRHTEEEDSSSDEGSLVPDTPGYYSPLEKQQQQAVELDGRASSLFIDTVKTAVYHLVNLVINKYLTDKCNGCKFDGLLLLLLQGAIVTGRVRY
ncbi:uncharacterized protein LOC143419297 [Maylandia zebra]|uniref:uncharacterized protein LOC143419297 n=1 Tax=Maylandia zebra TaxID=106582 RepID=UPI00403C8CF7